MTENIKIIDAENKSLGRIASQVALILRGKDQPDFQKHLLSKTKVEIINASKLKLTGKKLNQKTYYRHSGYPGGLKEEKLDKLIERLGYAEVFKKAIFGMLPNNKLRAEMMKKIIIKE